MLRELTHIAGSKGWVLRGTATGGSFSDSTGMLKGQYRVGKTSVDVTIVKKPFFYSWHDIESKLGEYFS